MLDARLQDVRYFAGPINDSICGTACQRLGDRAWRYAWRVIALLKRQDMYLGRQIKFLWIDAFEFGWLGRRVMQGLFTAVYNYD